MLSSVDIMSPVQGNSVGISSYVSKRNVSPTRNPTYIIIGTTQARHSEIGLPRNDPMSNKTSNIIIFSHTPLL
jgi:hypothetical protein